MTHAARPPLVGIATCVRDLAGYPQHAVPARYAHALSAGAGVVPVLLPPVGEAMLAALDRLDGLLLSGSPSNVAPALYGAGEDETPDEHDPVRDATTLPLVRAALARGMPVLGICRGVQEMNVALGGTLHQRVHAVAGRDDHRGEEGGADFRYRPKHAVTLSGALARLLGGTEIMVNSVHGQALDRVADPLAVEAVAPDGTVEAVRVRDARFAFGVQWHPEWRFAEDPASLALLRAFGAACAG